MKERFEIFTVLISRIHRSIKRIKAMEMGDFKLKGPHVSCIYYLHKNKSLTTKELCEICQEDKALVSRSLETLEKEGFLHKSGDKNKYRRRISLSEKGKKTGKQVAEKIDNILKNASKGICEENRVLMYESLNLIDANLSKICNNYGDVNGD